MWPWTMTLTLEFSRSYFEIAISELDLSIDIEYLDIQVHIFEIAVWNVWSAWFDKKGIWVDSFMLTLFNLDL